MREISSRMGTIIADNPEYHGGETFVLVLMVY